MTPQELKDSIIRLAMQGKLVEQRAAEGNAHTLRLSIDADRKQKVQNKTVKENKKIEPITEEDIPFDIPDSWEWIRFGEMVFYNMGKTPPRAELEWWNNDFPWVSIADMPENEHITKTKECVSMAAIAEKFSGKIAKAGTLLMSFKLTVGRVSILDIDAVHNEAIISIYPYADSEGTIQDYLFQLLPYISQFGDSRNAIKGKTLNDTSISNLLIPLPPLAEQKRIVAKIEELLPLIDRYEQAWSRLEDFNKRFPVDMQKSILQMAIQGKLVPQVPEEGTASVLKKELQKKKAEWVASGRILKKADSKPFLDSDDLFDIPDSWEWVQLSDVSIIQEGAGIRKWQYRDAGTQILCVTNILEGDIDLEKKKLYISTDEYLEKYRHLTLNKGDIVTSCSGGSWGKIAFFDCEDTMMLNTSTLRMRFFDDLADNNYLYYVCKSPFFKRQLELQLSGMQPNFGYAHYSRILLPLPPLAEQKRIVAKLEEILPLCERLK